VDFATLGIQLGFTLWHIAETVSELPMFAYPGIRLNANCHNFITSHFSGTEFWQIAENGARLATVENKLKFLRWCIAKIYV
jgi:hypothetical protein